MLEQPTAEDTVTANGGFTLHCERFAPVGAARASAVFLHGFAVHCGSYRHVGHALAAAGFASTAFDCQGHGRSAGRRGYVRRFSDFHDDLALVIERTRAELPGRPLVIVAHSHGATIALDTLLARRGSADALVVAAPY